MVEIFVRAILGWLRRRAHRVGEADWRGGGVAIVQRFGAALNLNVHIHEPVELLERLAALIPRPRINLVLYHGVLAPRAAWRALVVPAPIDETSEASASKATVHAHGRRHRTWADLMQRSSGFDVLACPHCSGRLTLVALIQVPAIIERILTHLGLPVDVPVMRPSRAPPLPFDGCDDQRSSGDD